MTVRCLIDTNVLIDYLNGKAAPDFVANVEQALMDGSMVSVITTMELLGWRGHSEQSRADAENLLRGMREIGLTRPIVGEVIKLRGLLAIKLPDAIIAASARVEGVPLMTGNARDFMAIADFSLLDPAGP